MSNDSRGDVGRKHRVDNTNYSRKSANNQRGFLGENGNRGVRLLTDSENKEFSDFHYSRKTPSDTVTISKGEMQKRKANYENEKVYSKGEIKAAFEKIAIFKALPTDIRSSYVNETWRRFNTFKDDQRLKMAIELTADKFFADVLSCGEIEYKENVKRIAALKKKRQKV